MRVAIERLLSTIEITELFLLEDAYLCEAWTHHSSGMSAIRHKGIPRHKSDTHVVVMSVIFPLS